MHTTRRSSLIVILALVLCACGGKAAVTQQQPVPSVAGQFQQHATVEIATPLGTTPFPTRPPRPSATPSQRIVEVPIYTDDLSADWSLEASSGIRYTVSDKRVAHQGRAAVAVTPNADYGQLLFTLREGANHSYRREEVAGVSLWLNSGSEILEPGDLAVTVVGSNAFPYWVEDDRSVTVDDQQFFSETRLFYLGVSRSLDPDTWVELIVWLDQLPYDPDYTYITGIYVKNDVGFRQTYYIDNVQLLVLEAS